MYFFFKKKVTRNKKKCKKYCLARSQIVTDVALTEEILVRRRPLIQSVGATREAIDERLDALLTFEFSTNRNGACSLFVTERRPQAVDVAR